MNWHIFSKIHTLVGLEGSLAGAEGVSAALGVDSAFELQNYGLLHDVDVGHQTLHQVSSNDLQSHVQVPLGHVVREWTIEWSPEFLWLELSQIGVHNKNNKPSIEELAQESSFDNLTFLLRDRVFSNPTDKSNHALLQNSVDHNNDHGN